MSTTSNHILDVDGFPVPEGIAPRKRASRPPFLDLTRDGGIGKGFPSDRREGMGLPSSASHQTLDSGSQRWNERRVVTDSQAFVGEGTSKSRTVSERLQHRPLPAPPTHAAKPNADTERRGLPTSASSGMLSSRSSEHVTSNRFSLAITPSSSYASTPQTPARRPVGDRTSPTTPGMTDPRTLNRSNLIGVGELSTPRYTDARLHAQQDTPRRMQDRGRGVSSSTSYDSSVALSRAGDKMPAKRDRQVSGPRVREPKEERRGVPRLPSLGDLGTFKIPTPPSGSPSSPGPAAPHRTTHEQRHPQLPSTPSAQSILRQFGSTRDFSHLPPSPSSASIGQIMKSGSMGSLAFHASSETGKSSDYGPSRKERKTPTGTGSPRKSRPDERERKASMDEETREVMRRLDGLGKSSSGSLKRKGDEARRKSSGGCEPFFRGPGMCADTFV